MRDAWSKLYGNQKLDNLEGFITELEQFRINQSREALPAGWYKKAIVYSLYVDLFNRDFPGLEEKLPHLAGLGVNCLWLLPILESPMRDAGFDISDYRRIRPDLLRLPAGAHAAEQDRVFLNFLEKAHEHGIRVIFDIAINHVSDQHPWFLEALRSKQGPYRDYFIWSPDGKGFDEARIIFYGIEDSNWKKAGDEYFFHRFFDFQPDLNYRNPSVLLDMARNFLFWLERGVDGFRADAIPYLWKEEGTTCENHPTTHTVIKFFRAVLDYARPNTLLLAEACQKPHEVVKYFGDGDECNAGYHFPLMPQIFKAVAQQSLEPVRNTLSLEVTPAIPGNAQWFTFLRCHDELSLELVYVTEEDRKYIHDHYCRRPEWDFRLGQGISARLAELMDRDDRKTGLIFSIMLTLPGTPVIYYGDEFGKLNDMEYYSEMTAMTGKDDTRFLVRGRIDWDRTAVELSDTTSLTYKVYDQVSRMINTRKQFKVFGQGTLEWRKVRAQVGPAEGIMAYLRSYKGTSILVIHNLTGKEQEALMEGITLQGGKDLLGKEIVARQDGGIALKPYDCQWIRIE